MTSKFKWVFLCLVLLGLSVIGGGWWWLNTPLSFERQEAKITVPSGSSGKEVAELWSRSGLQVSPWLLAQWFKISGIAPRIHSGVYIAKPGVTPMTLGQLMEQGPQVNASVRFIEGWTFKQLRQTLLDAEDLVPDTASMTEKELMKAVGAPDGQAAEGRFFPDTYVYQRGTTDLSVLKQAYRLMQKRVDEAWQIRDKNSPLQSQEDLLILASIVEKETGAAADRGLVAGVFTNRLKIGMPLQTDPSVIYGLGETFDGNLRKRDLQTDTPYNTYTRVGLPPTPISLPGKASLMAAATPSATKALYFVAKGDGSSQFSENLNDHNRAVSKYQKGGR